MQGHDHDYWQMYSPNSLNNDFVSEAHPGFKLKAIVLRDLGGFRCNAWLDHKE